MANDPLFNFPLDFQSVLHEQIRTGTAQIQILYYYAQNTATILKPISYSHLTIDEIRSMFMNLNHGIVLKLLINDMSVYISDLNDFRSISESSIAKSPLLSHKRYYSKGIDHAISELNLKDILRQKTGQGRSDMNEICEASNNFFENKIENLIRLVHDMRFITSNRRPLLAQTLNRSYQMAKSTLDHIIYFLVSQSRQCPIRQTWVETIFSRNHLNMFYVLRQHVEGFLQASRTPQGEKKSLHLVWSKVDEAAVSMNDAVLPTIESLNLAMNVIFERSAIIVDQRGKWQNWIKLFFYNFGGRIPQNVIHTIKVIMKESYQSRFKEYINKDFNLTSDDLSKFDHMPTFRSNIGFARFYQYITIIVKQLISISNTLGAVERLSYARRRQNLEFLFTPDLSSFETNKKIFSTGSNYNWKEVFRLSLLPLDEGSTRTSYGFEEFDSYFNFPQSFDLSGSVYTEADTATRRSDIFSNENTISTRMSEIGSLKTILSECFSHIEDVIEEEIDSDASHQPIPNDIFLNIETDREFDRDKSHVPKINSRGENDKKEEKVFQAERQIFKKILSRATISCWEYANNAADLISLLSNIANFSIKFVSNDVLKYLEAVGKFSSHATFEIETELNSASAKETMNGFGSPDGVNILRLVFEGRSVNRLFHFLYDSVRFYLEELEQILFVCPKSLPIVKDPEYIEYANKVKQEDILNGNREQQDNFIFDLHSKDTTNNNSLGHQLTFLRGKIEFQFNIYFKQIKMFSDQIENWDISVDNDKKDIDNIINTQTSSDITGNDRSKVKLYSTSIFLKNRFSTIKALSVIILHMQTLIKQGRVLPGVLQMFSHVTDEIFADSMFSESPLLRIENEKDNKLISNTLKIVSDVLEKQKKSLSDILKFYKEITSIASSNVISRTISSLRGIASPNELSEVLDVSDAIFSLSRGHTLLSHTNRGGQYFSFSPRDESERVYRSNNNLYSHLHFQIRHLSNSAWLSLHAVRDDTFITSQSLPTANGKSFEQTQASLDSQNYIFQHIFVDNDSIYWDRATSEEKREKKRRKSYIDIMEINSDDDDVEVQSILLDEKKNKKQASSQSKNTPKRAKANFHSKINDKQTLPPNYEKLLRHNKDKMEKLQNEEEDYSTSDNDLLSPFDSMVSSVHPADDIDPKGYVTFHSTVHKDSASDSFIPGNFYLETLSKIAMGRYLMDGALIYSHNGLRTRWALQNTSSDRKKEKSGNSLSPYCRRAKLEQLYHKNGITLKKPDLKNKDEIKKQKLDKKGKFVSTANGDDDFEIEVSDENLLVDFDSLEDSSETTEDLEPSNLSPNKEISKIDAENNGIVESMIKRLTFKPNGKEFFRVFSKKLFSLDHSLVKDFGILGPNHLPLLDNLTPFRSMNAKVVRRKKEYRGIDGGLWDRFRQEMQHGKTLLAGLNQFPESRFEDIIVIKLHSDNCRITELLLAILHRPIEELNSHFNFFFEQRLVSNIPFRSTAFDHYTSTGSAYFSQDVETSFGLSTCSQINLQEGGLREQCSRGLMPDIYKIEQVMIGGFFERKSNSINKIEFDLNDPIDAIEQAKVVAVGAFKFWMDFLSKLILIQRPDSWMMFDSQNTDKSDFENDKKQTEKTVEAQRLLKLLDAMDEKDIIKQKSECSECKSKKDANRCASHLKTDKCEEYINHSWNNEDLCDVFADSLNPDAPVVDDSPYSSWESKKKVEDVNFYLYSSSVLRQVLRWLGEIRRDQPWNSLSESMAQIKKNFNLRIRDKTEDTIGRDRKQRDLQILRLRGEAIMTKITSLYMMVQSIQKTISDVNLIQADIAMAPYFIKASSENSNWKASSNNNRLNKPGSISLQNNRFVLDAMNVAYMLMDSIIPFLRHIIHYSRSQLTIQMESMLKIPLSAIDELEVEIHATRSIPLMFIESASVVVFKSLMRGKQSSKFLSKFILNIEKTMDEISKSSVSLEEIATNTFQKILSENGQIISAEEKRYAQQLISFAMKQEEGIRSGIETLKLLKRNQEKEATQKSSLNEWVETLEKLQNETRFETLNIRSKRSEDKREKGNRKPKQQETESSDFKTNPHQLSMKLAENLISATHAIEDPVANLNILDFDFSPNSIFGSHNKAAESNYIHTSMGHVINIKDALGIINISACFRSCLDLKVQKTDSNDKRHKKANESVITEAASEDGSQQKGKDNTNEKVTIYEQLCIKRCTKNSNIMQLYNIPGIKKALQKARYKRQFPKSDDVHLKHEAVANSSKIASTRTSTQTSNINPQITNEKTSQAETRRRLNQNRCPTWEDSGQTKIKWEDCYGLQSKLSEALYPIPPAQDPLQFPVGTWEKSSMFYMVSQAIGNEAFERWDSLFTRSLSEFVTYIGGDNFGNNSQYLKKLKKHLDKINFQSLSKDLDFKKMFTPHFGETQSIQNIFSPTTQFRLIFLNVFEKLHIKAIDNVLYSITQATKLQDGWKIEKPPESKNKQVKIDVEPNTPIDSSEIPGWIWLISAVVGGGIVGIGAVTIHRQGDIKRPRLLRRRHKIEEVREDLLLT